MKGLLYRITVFFCINLVIFCPNYNVQADDAISDKTPSDSTDFSKEEPLANVLNIAQQIKEPLSKFEVLAEISTAYIELGEYNKAEYILSKAFNIAQDTKNQFSKAILLSELIDRYISLKENEKALEIVKNIDFSDSRADALVKIVTGYIQQNQYEKALKLIEGIDEPFSKALAFCKLINKLTEQELYTEVVKIQKITEQSSPEVQRFIRMILLEEDTKISDNPITNLFTFRTPLKKTKALIAIGKSCISLKLYEPAKYILAQAILISKEIKSEYLRDDSLAQIADTYTQIGEYERALEIANSLKIPLCRSESLAKIAVAYMQSGEFDKALTIIKDIDSQYLKEQALGQIIIQYVKMDKEKEVSPLIDLFGQNVSRDRTYSAVADYYVQEGKYEKAIEISKIIKDRFIKLKILLSIAKSIQERKNFSPEIQKIFSETTASFN